MTLDLLAAIDAWVDRDPGRLAHVSGGRSLTYGELVAGSRALAARLERELPDDQSPIALLGHKESELLIGFLACLRLRRPYVPLDTGLPPARVEKIVAAARAARVLTPPEIATLATGDLHPTDRGWAADDLHYIMFTSGSTGEPKGVPITRGNLLHFLDWMALEHPFRPAAEVVLNQVIYSFDVSHMDTYPCLVNGGTLVSLSREEIGDPRRLFQVLAGTGVTIWVSTPTFVAMCLVEKRFDHVMLPELRRFLFCGETLPPETAAALLARFPEAEVWNTYGPTEATVATTSIRIDAEILARYSPLPIGRSMPGSRVLIVDGQLRPVAPGSRGEILIVGPNVSPGYLHRPDLTSRAFLPFEGQPAYRTGDWGHEEDGWLFCDGRMDNQIKLHGFRIELGDIEAQLCALPGVLSAAVLPVRKQEQVDSLTAYVVMGEDGERSDQERAAELRAGLLERVPTYMVPRRFRFLPAFPMTPNGKIDRRSLTDLPTY